MAKFHARNASIYVRDTSSASQSVSGDANSVELSYSADAPDVTSFGDNTRQRLSDGLIEWEMSVNGFVNNTYTTAATCILFALVGGSTDVQFGPNGSTSGCRKYTGCAVCTEFSQSYEVEGAATFAATFVSRSGSLTASQW